MKNGKKILSLTCSGLLMLGILLLGVSCQQNKAQLTDPEIASVAVTANQIDIDHAGIALKKSHNKKVLDFAKNMQRDHKAIIKKATDLVQKLGVTPKSNDMSQSLKDGAKGIADSLKTLSGTDFDKAYIDNEIAYHQTVIDAVKNKLIPEAENEQLKDLLSSVVPILKTHLKHAEKVKQALKEEAEKAAEASPKLTDPEIASVAVTANKIDVEYAEIALKKADNDKVKEFAQNMKNDHTNIINKAVALAKELNVTPKTNKVTKSLLEGAKQEKEKLKSKSGSDFDKTYIDNEVKYHKAVINAVENTLIPQTQNGQLKELLQSVMPILKTHLKHAEKVQSSIE